MFYEVGKEHLHRYADFGLTFVKLGEEARVDLTQFTLEGARGKPLPPGAPPSRASTARRSASLPASEVPAVIDELRAVSDDWLEHKAGGEKGFSLGFFDPTYLARFPVAVVEQAGRIVAFANLWPGPGTIELSVDLMRYSHDAPNGVMEGLFVHLMRWGKEQGYRWSGSAWRRSPGSSARRWRLWTRLGSFLYAHGEASTTSRACARTKRSSTRSGSRAISPIPAASAAAHPRGRVGADRRRLSEDLAQMKEVRHENTFSTARVQG